MLWPGWSTGGAQYHHGHTTHTVPTDQNLVVITGTSPYRVLAAGYLGAGILHWDGSSWTRFDDPGGNFFAAWAHGTAVWLGGLEGTILHRP